MGTKRTDAIGSTMNRQMGRMSKKRGVQPSCGQILWVPWHTSGDFLGRRSVLPRPLSGRGRRRLATGPKYAYRPKMMEMGMCYRSSLDLPFNH
jgi:hypothetical protein